MSISLLRVADHTGVGADELLEHAIRRGDYSVDEFREMLDDIEPAD